MFGAGKVKLDKNLLSRAKEFADKVGYSSVDEFITHLVERELAQLEQGGSDEEVKKRLQGLGYL